MEGVRWESQALISWTRQVEAIECAHDQNDNAAIVQRRKINRATVLKPHPDLIAFVVLLLLSASLSIASAAGPFGDRCSPVRSSLAAGGNLPTGSLRI